MNIFERASRRKIRFLGSVGEMTAEQLWDLTLVDLDSLARITNNELKAVTVESFIDLKPNKEKTIHELKLDILKHIIASKLADEDAVKARAEKAIQRQKLMDALSVKENEALHSKSEKELRKDLAKLS